MNFYNEWNIHAAQWLKSLCAAGKIPDGEVFSSDIRDLKAGDCGATGHFFAGIGGWPLALDWAGYRSLECWTGSTPCQPFSTAGRRKGFDDERDLWPVWLKLIAECRPPIIFGEQSASKAGRAWLSRLRADLEALGYRIGAADLCAAGAGAPHIRQRLYFGAVADSYSREPKRDRYQVARKAKASSSQAREQWVRAEPNPSEPACRVADAPSPGPFIILNEGEPNKEPLRLSGIPDWRADVVECRDGRRRPIEPGTWPLAHGFPGRLELIRGYGNAVVPQLAAQFVAAFMESI